MLSASANALKVITNSHHDRMSYLELHRINKRATPEEFCKYKHALQLHQLTNKNLPKQDFVDLNFQQITNARKGTLSFIKDNNYKIGLNLMCNRLNVINNKIDSGWMSESYDTYKVRCKGIFLNI